MAVKVHHLIAASVVAVVAAVCCATPVVVAAIGAVGLIAWLAKAGNVLVPVVLLCTGLAGLALYRRQGREQ